MKLALLSESPADEAATEALLGPCMARLKALSQSLWSEGREQPSSADDLDALFADIAAVAPRATSTV